MNGDIYVPVRSSGELGEVCDCMVTLEYIVCVCVVCFGNVLTFAPSPFFSPFSPSLHPLPSPLPFTPSLLLPLPIPLLVAHMGTWLLRS